MTAFRPPIRQQMAPTLLRITTRGETRDSNSFESSGISRLGVYIIVSSVAGALLLGVILWLAIRILRRRMQEKTCNGHKAPLIPIQGVAEEIEHPATDDKKPSSPK